MNILEKLRMRPTFVVPTQLGLHKSVAAPVAFQPNQSDAASLFVSTPKIAPSSLKAKLEARSRHRNPTGFQDIDRIVKLPISTKLEPEEIEEYCRHNILKEAFQDGFRFFPIQAQALLEYDLYERIFCPIGVGDGKTLISICVASKAFERGIKKIMLLVPSQVYSQLVTRDIAWARHRVPVRVPFILLGDLPRKKRLMLANSNRPGCYVLPYSCLSLQDSSDVLHSIGPQLIIADEAHKLSSRKAARTQRMLNYIEKYAFETLGIDVELVPLSGTITNKAIAEYHHLIRYSLKDMSPLPLSPMIAGEWGQYIDSKAEYTGSNPGPIKLLVDWAREKFPETPITDDVTGFRAAFRTRLNTAPGVVATEGSHVGASLYINWVQPQEQPSDKLNELMTKVIDDGVTPNGDQIEHAMHGFKWLFELTAGFYNELSWPKVGPKVSAEILFRSQQHHDLSQIFNQEMRKWLSRNYKKGLDTPLLVRSNLAKHGARDTSHELHNAWLDMKASDFPEKIARDERVVRVCDYKVKAAVSWCKAHTKAYPGTGAILWCYHKEMVDWVCEALLDAGFDPLHAHAGKDVNELLIFEKHPEVAKRIVVASMTAHAEGKNLQHGFSFAYNVQWPRGARLAEQMLGRLHREGQPEDEVHYIRTEATLFDHLLLAACLNDALYIQQTTGNRQKMIYAGYDPLPTIFPPQVLRERGMQPKILSERHQKIMSELFGNPETEIDRS